MAHEREIAEEQEFLHLALAALEKMRDEARYLRDSAQVAAIKTMGAFVERDVVMGTALHRLEQLAIGDQPLFFGRIDYAPSAETSDTHFHVGRLAVSDENLNPLVVDWRAPVAEPFYRATGVESLGLSRRRHISIRDHLVTGVEDEYFADENGQLSLPEGDVRAATEEGLVDGGLALGGPGALLAALGQARTGRMGDIVATIQGEQDRIIRAPLQGILLVQGGPGTGKTAVALHRAAYLLFTHRDTLERHGVLVVGPNPLFLNYIENVLPSLGESGVTLSTLSGLVSNVVVRATELEEVARIKGDMRMVKILERAVRTRQRALRDDVSIPVGRATMVLTAAMSKEAVDRARRRPGNHNQRRSMLGRELALRLAHDYLPRFRNEESDEAVLAADVADTIRHTPEFRAAMRRMWPRLSGQELLHDLFGATALIRAAAGEHLSEEEIELLARPRSTSMSDIGWTDADAALIDEARVLLGPRRRPRSGTAAGVSADVLEGINSNMYNNDIRQAALREAAVYATTVAETLDEAEFATFGHIVVDEAQDLSPMQLRVLKRRDLSGSMTIVGDMGQATTAASSASWDATLRILEPKRQPLLVTLSVSYRTPEEVLDKARPTLKAAMPNLEPPRPVRRAGVMPRSVATSTEGFAADLVTVVREELAAVAAGRLAVAVTSARVAEIVAILRSSGLDAIDPRDSDSRGLSADLVVIGAEGSNGLEFDGIVVVEPLEIAARGNAVMRPTPRGLRTLYVALTRPTRRLALVHALDLPPTLI